MFYRLSTDGTRTDVALESTFAGTYPSACWLIGGGPSLRSLPLDLVRESPAPKMAINLSGVRLLRPTFWTSYDPSCRFHRSIYLDAGVMKFVHRRRAMDLVPETTFKVCDCPNLYFFDRDGSRGFADFVSPARAGIIDWADTMVQAIDVLYRLGFRTLYLAGCELRIRPSRAQRARAAASGVTWRPGELLRDFVKRCEGAGVCVAELDALGPVPLYHFEEHKPLRAAANADLHYFRIAQSLRLTRRSLALAGLRLVSVTPHSRLNDYFPYVPVRQAAERLRRQVGDPQTEAVSGMYSRTEPRLPRGLGPMRDYPPHGWHEPRREAAAHVNGTGRRAPERRSSADGDLQVEFEQLERVEGIDVGRGGYHQRLWARITALQDDRAVPEEEG